jgi:TRAP-type C4-dicarboxylate transport system substrate-binding protein
VNNQPAIFIMVEFSRKWYDALPKDLQKIVSDDAVKEARDIIPWGIDYNKQEDAVWTKSGGELIKFPPDEEATYLSTLKSVGADVSKSKPAVRTAYDLVTEAAKRDK